MSTASFPPQSAVFNFGSRGSLDRRDGAVVSEILEPADLSNKVVADDSNKSIDMVVQQPVQSSGVVPDPRVNTTPSSTIHTQSLQDLENVISEMEAPPEQKNDSLQLSEEDINSMLDEEQPSQLAQIYDEPAAGDSTATQTEQTYIAPTTITEEPLETVSPAEASITQVGATVEADEDVDFADMEDLYKMNPEVFGSMPTREFREKVKQIQLLEQNIQISQVKVGKLEAILNDIDDKIVARELISESQVTGIIGGLVESLSFLDKDDINSIESAFKSVPEQDWFDMSPRRIMEGYRAIIKQYVDEAVNSKDNLTKLRDDFYAQYRV